MTKCSIGILLDVNCEAGSTLHNVADLSDTTTLLISIRTKIEKKNLTTVCSYHLKQFIDMYSLNVRKCCDPHKKHKKPVRSNLVTITLQQHASNSKLLPGDTICYHCLTEVKKEPAHSLTDTSSNDEFVPDRPYIDQLNESLQAFKVSPIKKRLSTSQIQRKISVKKQKLDDKLTQIVSGSTSYHKLPVIADMDEIEKNDNSMLALTQLLKDKYVETTSFDERLQLLTLVPQHWSIERTADEFACTKYMVRTSRSLKERLGILGLRDRKPGRKLSEEMQASIKSIYEDDEYSRMCPGAKDFVTV
jgi:hypothetical protein